MVNNEDALLIGAGAIGGIGAPYLIRRCYDTDDNGQLRQFIPHFGAFGTPSAMFGIGTGVVGAAVGLLGNRIGVRDRRARTVAFTYGIAALATGVASAYDPAATAFTYGIAAATPMVAASRARVVQASAAPTVVRSTQYIPPQQQYRRLPTY